MASITDRSPKTDRKLDPLARSITCPECREARLPFTVEGVLYDWCWTCRREVRVPVRYADPELAAAAAIRRGAPPVSLESAFEAFLRSAEGQPEFEKIAA